MKKRESIYQFNHIDERISHDKLSEIKALYAYYHKKYWCYMMAYKYFKRLNLIISITSTGLIVIGTIVGGITLNPIILGSVSGAGVLLETYNKIKDYKKKIEMSKFAYSEYENVLVELRAYLRGTNFDHNSFIQKMELIDGIIIDLCPLVDKFKKKYDEKFTVEE